MWFSLSLDFKKVHMIMKTFGPIRKIRLKMTEDEHSLSCYVVFGSGKCALDAHT